MDHDHDECFLCGKTIRIGPRRLWVELLCTYTPPRWRGLVRKGEEHDGPDSQGWFPVGPDCAKTLPDNVATKTTEEIMG